jgi:hypothetical protein
MGEPRLPRGRALASLAALGGLVALATACSYGFEGGGFPSHIQTIYIAPFENETPQFDLEQRLFDELIDELPAKLGLRAAGEGSADAILRGTIRRYDDVAQAYRAGDATQTPDILSHEVQIGITAELIDVRDNVIRWSASSLIGRGTYRPDTETDERGKAEAIENIIEQIIDGAQSQW